MINAVHPEVSPAAGRNPEGCLSCIELRSNGERSIYTSESSRCIKGSFEDNKGRKRLVYSHGFLSFERLWTEIVVKASVHVFYSTTGWHHIVDIDLSAPTQRKIDYGIVEVDIDQYPFDKRIFNVHLKNGSEHNELVFYVVIEYENGYYVKRTNGDCTRCCVTKDIEGPIRRKFGPFEDCPQGTREAHATRPFSFEIPDTWIVQKIAIVVTSSYNIPKFEIVVPLTSEKSVTTAAWLSIITSVYWNYDRRIVSVLLDNWSHDNSRHVEAYCLYLQGTCVPPDRIKANSDQPIE